jgi:hypothetical protein
MKWKWKKGEFLVAILNATLVQLGRSGHRPSAIAFSIAAQNAKRFL